MISFIEPAGVSLTQPSTLICSLGVLCPNNIDGNVGTQICIRIPEIEKIEKLGYLKYKYMEQYKYCMHVMVF